MGTWLDCEDLPCKEENLSSGLQNPPKKAKHSGTNLQHKFWEAEIEGPP